jgi:hypothetical protein
VLEIGTGPGDAYEVRLGGARDVWQDIEDASAEWTAAAVS